LSFLSSAHCAAVATSVVYSCVAKLFIGGSIYE
jgi:hypothetical protein